MRRGLATALMVLLVGGCTSGESDPSPVADVDALIEQFGISEAALEDVQFAAEERGLTLAEALDRFGWHEAFSRFVQELRDTYPQDFTNAAIVAENGPRAVFIAFASEIPREVLEDPRLSHLDVEFRSGLGFNERDLVDQTETVHFAIRHAGFLEVYSVPDLSTGLVLVQIERRPGDDGKPDSDIIESLPAVALADNVRIELVDELLHGHDDSS